MIRKWLRLNAGTEWRLIQMFSMGTIKFCLMVAVVYYVALEAVQNMSVLVAALITMKMVGRLAPKAEKHEAEYSS